MMYEYLQKNSETTEVNKSLSFGKQGSDLSKSLKLNHSAEVKAQLNKDRRTSLRPITIRWTNRYGNVCKKIIKESLCFCNHKYGSHEYHYLMKPFCKVEGCECKCFEYIPTVFDMKCLCKHSYKSHHPETKKCTLCSKCSHFLSSWACSKCSLKYHEHETKVTEEWDKEVNKLPHENLGSLPQIDKGSMCQKQTNFNYGHNIDYIDERRGEDLSDEKLENLDRNDYGQESWRTSENDGRLYRKLNDDESIKVQRNRLKAANCRVNRIQEGQQQCSLSRSPKNRDCSVNKVHSLNSHESQDNHRFSHSLRGQAKELKRQPTSPNSSLQNVDYSGTGLELILTPHKFRFLTDLNRIS